MLTLAGKPVIDSLAPGLEQQLSQFKSTAKRSPRLDVLLIGDHPASQLYVRNKKREAERLGVTAHIHGFSVGVRATEVRDLIERLNRDETVDGILVQRPLPESLPLPEVAQWIDPRKDVDAFHPLLLGRLALGSPLLTPCTPAGIIALLAHYKIELAGKVACVVGRSPIVGKPLAYMLLNSDASVIHCHSRSKNLATLTSQADILIVAAGIPGLIGREHVKRGAVVVDVGIHRRADGSISGDVRATELEGVADALTPVPGGVGPMTIFMLMKNVVSAAQARLDTAGDSSVREF